MLLETGGLLRLMAKCMLCFSPKAVFNAQIVELADKLGILYQIRDDCINLISEQVWS